MDRANEAFQAWAAYLRRCHALPIAKEAFVYGYMAGYDAAKDAPKNPAPHPVLCTADCQAEKDYLRNA